MDELYKMKYGKMEQPTLSKARRGAYIGPEVAGPWVLMGFPWKLIQKLRQKGVYEESFSRHAAWIGGKLIPVHAYYNGSCTSKDNEDPSWSTSFKTALEALWKTLFVLYLYLIGT
ncbi:hypothetical protein Tco_1325644, partial [Tanacetum coccineum]